MPTTALNRSGNRFLMRRWILFAGIATILVVWQFRDALHGWVVVRGTLANDAPTPELFEDYLRQSPDRERAILEAWNTGKIVHRHLAIRHLSGGWLDGTSLSRELEAMLLSGALDPDMNVRELALQGLHLNRHPDLPALAATQLTDPDPEIRMLGLSYIRYAEPDLGVAQIAPLVDDPDLRVAARTMKLLEQWAGEEFDLKLSDAVEVVNRETGLMEFRPEGIARIHAASVRAHEWLSRHGAGDPVARIEIPPLAVASLMAVPAGDFRLPTPEGRMVRLSEFQGRPVILNFWTTWCTACLAEIPALIELQKRYGEKLTILGISLDYVADSHGHAGHEAHAEHDHEGHDRPSSKEVRARVTRTASKLGVNYIVLMDERNEVGGRFNGGELPTTVLIDPQGNVRRRFVGARALPTFEAMVEEVLRDQNPIVFPVGDALNRWIAGR